jgi:hypothetical protein
LYNYVLHLVPEENTDEEEKTEDKHWTEWGTIIHYALENYVRDVKGKKHLTFDEMKKYFEEKQKELLENEPKSTILNKEQQLETYFDKILKNVSPDKFEDVEKQIEFTTEGGFYFTGKIDRIDKTGEKNKDGKEKYNIIDYKTGKNKSKVKNEAKVGKKYEKIYNQLAFYKYVLTTKYEMPVDEVSIEFPEEPESSFSIDDLKGDDGLKKCKDVVDNYDKILNEIKNIKETENAEARLLFECNPKCKKGGEYCFCDFTDFCSSNVL